MTTNELNESMLREMRRDMTGTVSALQAERQKNAYLLRDLCTAEQINERLHEERNAALRKLADAIKGGNELYAKRDELQRILNESGAIVTQHNLLSTATIAEKDATLGRLLDWLNTYRCRRV